MHKFRFLAVTLILGAASLSVAQSALLNLPLQSQAAVVTQTVGITNITINYHRPLANGRKVWGGLVPYGQVWRAGANLNTTITFSDPVTVEGKALPAGSYGLHMIPNENEWTVIFSKANTAWGSYSYKENEDELRINVKPVSADMHNALTYDFDQLNPESVVATMSWDKVAVPFKISVNVPDVVAASLHSQLRGLQQYTWEAWDEAANYLLTAKYDLKDALTYSDNSIGVEERFDNLMTKSQVLDAMGDKQQAATVRTKALEMGSATQLYGYARQLQRNHQSDEAFAIYRSLEKKYPDNWITHAGAARLYSNEGKYDDAVKEMQLCLASAPDVQKTGVESLIKRLQAKQDINK